MSLLCALDCGEVEVTLNPDYSPCKFERRDWGYSRLIRIKCDEVFTDINDPEEWAAKITAGAISVSPVGQLNIGEPSFTTLITSGCGEETPGSQEYPLDFTTFRTDKDLADYAFFKEVQDNVQNTRLILMDCNGIFHLSDEYYAGLVGGNGSESQPIDLSTLSPGFNYSLTRVPQFVENEGPGKTGNWVVNFKIIKQGMFNGIYLPGVPSVIG
jgi:hypothetical protein